MRERLIRSTHDSKADVLIAAFHEPGDDGVIRTLATRQNVGMLGIQTETRAAILQHESHAIHRDSRAERGKDTLNPAGDVALAVDDGQINGIAAGNLRRRDISRSLFVDSSSAARCRA